jgi:hypothetical protein
MPRLAFCVLTLLVESCGSSATEGPGEIPAPTEEWVEVDLELGPGPLDLTEMLTGLDELASYRATLTITFDGTEQGAASQWSSTYVMLSSTEPETWQWTADHGSRAASEWLAGRGGMLYALSEDGACFGTMLDPENPYARPEPADELAGVLGAETSEHQTINGIEADGYTFDERALAQADLTDSNGDLWLATDGGYLVRYFATTVADERFFGQGSSGKMTWDYELTDVSGELAFPLPEDCPAGPVDAPRLPDASNIVNVPGLLEYDTATSVAEALAFYEEQLPALGWGPPVVEGIEGEPEFEVPNLTPEELAMMEQFFGTQPAAEETAPSRAYARGGDILTLFIEQVEGTTHVALYVDRDIE